tara:strand:- start:335 stop:670 length:336 start_codon:yes stop_codon:yes gene_type:complete
VDQRNNTKLKRLYIIIMNTQQAIVVVFMTGLLFVLIGVLFSALEEQLKNPVFIRYILTALIMLAWVVLVSIGDLYMVFYDTKTDLKNYQKQNHEKIMQNYVDVSNASCPTK